MDGRGLQGRDAKLADAEKRTQAGRSQTLARTESGAFDLCKDKASGFKCGHAGSDRGKKYSGEV